MYIQNNEFLEGKKHRYNFKNNWNVIHPWENMRKNMPMWNPTLEFKYFEVVDPLWILIIYS